MCNATDKTADKNLSTKFCCLAHVAVFIPRSCQTSPKLLNVSIPVKFVPTPAKSFFEVLNRKKQMLNFLSDCSHNKFCGVVKNHAVHFQQIHN